MATNNNEKDPTKSFFKEWLEKLQQESWQLELLISGLALFGVWEARGLLAHLDLDYQVNAYGDFRVAYSTMLFTLKKGWLIFFINLLVHIILRGLWIGAIGLRYVSREIEYDDLNYSSYFTEYFKRTVGDYDDFIEWLEKVCSIIFAYTFLLFLILLSVNLFFLECGLIMVLIGNIFGQDSITAQSVGGLIVILYVAMGFLVFLDFATLGGGKKIKDPIISKIYGVIYKFVGFATLSFLYRPLLLNFIDNKFTRKFVLLTIPYIAFMIFSKNLFINENYPYFLSSNEYGTSQSIIQNSEYDDLRNQMYKQQFQADGYLQKMEIPLLSLNAFEVESPWLKIYLRQLPSDQVLLKEKYGINPFRDIGFSVFSINREFDDPMIDSIYAASRDQMDELRKERSQLRDQRRKSSDEAEKTKLSRRIEFVAKTKDSLLNKTRLEAEEYQATKTESIVNTYLDIYQMQLDGEPIASDCDCYFYIHPNFEEQMIQCLLRVDSLSPGKHMITYERTGHSRRRKQEFWTRKGAVPFYVAK